jgi:hypothetical protein
MRELPDSAFTRLRHMQFHIGCQNRCSCCSQGAGKDMFILRPAVMRDLIAAIGAELGRRGIRIAQESERQDVAYNYLDNDPFQSPYLATQVELVFDNLGTKMRMATAGFPRRNEAMRRAHQRLAEVPHKLAGLRFSFSDYPYAVTKGAERRGDASRRSYEVDLSENLKIYRSLLLGNEEGRKGFNIEIRYRPLIVPCAVEVPDDHPHFVLRAGTYLVVGKFPGVRPQCARLLDPLDHSLQFDLPGIQAWLMRAPKNRIDSEWRSLVAQRLAHPDAEDCPGWSSVELYQFKNDDGIYYGVDPRRERGGFGSKYFYPRTGNRPGSGIIDEERYGLNAILAEAAERMPDPESVLQKLRLKADELRPIDPGAADYVLSSVVAHLESLIRVLRGATLPAELIFNKSVVSDTGHICNLGRAYGEYKAIASRPNLPLTPHHERSFGVAGELAQEGVAWRMAIHPGAGSMLNSAQLGARNPTHEYPAVIFEMLTLQQTATTAGQSMGRHYIRLPKGSIEHVTQKNLATEYWIPGQIITANPSLKKMVCL